MLGYQFFAAESLPEVVVEKKKSFHCNRLRKIGIPLHTTFLLYRSGVWGIICFSWTLFPDTK